MKKEITVFLDATDNEVVSVALGRSSVVSVSKKFVGIDPLIALQNFLFANKIHPEQITVWQSAQGVGRFGRTRAVHIICNIAALLSGGRAEGVDIKDDGAHNILKAGKYGTAKYSAEPRINNSSSH